MGQGTGRNVRDPLFQCAAAQVSRCGDSEEDEDGALHDRAPLDHGVDEGMLLPAGSMAHRSLPGVFHAAALFEDDPDNFRGVRTPRAVGAAGGMDGDAGADDGKGEVRHVVPPLAVMDGDPVMEQGRIPVVSSCSTDNEKRAAWMIAMVSAGCLCRVPPVAVMRTGSFQCPFADGFETPGRDGDPEDGGGRCDDSEKGWHHGRTPPAAVVESSALSSFF